MANAVHDMAETTDIPVPRWNKDFGRNGDELKSHPTNFILHTHFDRLVGSWVKVSEQDEVMLRTCSVIGVMIYITSRELGCGGIVCHDSFQHQIDPDEPITHDVNYGKRK